MNITLATNVSLIDAACIISVFPHWLNVFGTLISEFLVVLDLTPVEGRIAEQNRGRASSQEKLKQSLEDFAKKDSRVRWVEVLSQGAASEAVLKKWFGDKKLVRCQTGTPILPMVYSISESRSDRVLRLDCDMVFTASDWVKSGLQKMAETKVDLVSAPRMGVWSESTETLSSRALIFNKKQLEDEKLPIKAWELDPLRKMHRWFQRRSSWLPFEQMLQKEIELKKLAILSSDSRGGVSMHLGPRQIFDEYDIDWVIAKFEKGEIPQSQIDRGWDFIPEAWGLTKKSLPLKSECI